MTRTRRVSDRRAVEDTVLGLFKQHTANLGRLPFVDLEGPLLNAVVCSRQPLVPISHTVPQRLAFLHHARHVLVQLDQIKRAECFLVHVVEAGESVARTLKEARTKLLSSCEKRTRVQHHVYCWNFTSVPHRLDWLLVRPERNLNDLFHRAWNRLGAKVL